MPAKKENALEVATPLTPAVTEDEIRKFILGSDNLAKMSKAAQELCIATAMQWGLNPLKREIHFVSYNGQDPKIVVGYDVYVKKANEVKLLNGWNVKIEGEPDKRNTWKAILTIYRKDWEQPFIWEVYYPEVVQTRQGGEPNSQWAKAPRFMLKKVAIGQGFRLGVPEAFGGMPYMADELGLEEDISHQPIPERDFSKPEDKVTDEPVTSDNGKPEPLKADIVQDVVSEIDDNKLADEVAEGLSKQDGQVTDNFSTDWLDPALEEDGVTDDDMEAMYALAAKKGFPNRDDFNRVLCKRFKIANETLMTREQYTIAMSGLEGARDR